MAKSARLNAEAQFAKIKQQDTTALKERESAARERSDKIDRLRALRLAKETAEREAAAAAPAKPARKIKAASKTASASS
jgi:hypothetical protein